MNNENSKPGKIYAAINSIMTDVEAVPKGQKNNQQNYSYRGIDDLYAALHSLLAKHKVFATKEVLSHNREERTTPKGTLLIYAIMEVRFTYHAEDGSYIVDTTVGEAMDSGDKASNKAMSSAFKYSLMQLFAIPTSDKGKDTEEQHHEVAPKFKSTADQKELITKLMKSHVFNDEDKDFVKKKWAAAKSNKDISDIIEWAQEEIKVRKQLEKEAEQYEKEGKS